MKKMLFALTVFTLLFALVACVKTSSPTDTSNASGPLSPEMQLLVGTFKLEGTDQAVTAAQAEQLLPLWQTLQSLSTSSTAATEELDAVVNQIKSTMTSQQMDKITAMKLTQQDMMSLMSQAGVSPNGASSAETPVALNGLPSSGGGMPSGGGDMPSGGGGMPSGGGGMPSGGGGMPSGGGGDFPAGGVTGMGGAPGDASSTPQAIRSNEMANRVPPPLLNALIELLQKKVQQ